MGKFRDQAGNIWEVGPDGQPHLVSQGGSPNVVMPAPIDPLAPYKLQQEQGQAAAAPYAAPKAQADAQIAQANAGTAGVVANAEAMKAQADAAKAKFELDKLRAQQATVNPKSGAYHALQQQIDRVTALYGQELQGGAPNAVNNLIPDFLQPKVDAFDSAAQGLYNPFMAAFKVQGQGSQSDADLKQFLAANTPAQGDSDAVIEEKIRTLQTRLNADVPPQQTDKTAPLVDNGQQQNQVTPSQGMKDEIDPVLKGIAGRLGKMVSAGATDATVLEFLRKNGVDPASTNIQGVLQHRKTQEYKNWQRANPGKAYPIGPEFYTNQVPMGVGRKIGNAAAQSDLGAYAMNAAQGVTGNRLDELAGALGGDPEAVNTGLQLSRASSPKMSFLGDLSGQAMAQYLMGRVPGLRALPGSSVGRMGEDALYGAYAGQGEGDTAGGVAANVIGGKLGRGLGRATGVAARGVSGSNSLHYLDNANVPLTPGRIGRGTDSTLGNSIGGIEERAAGLPIFDAIIGSARRRGDEGFNREMFRQIDGSGSGNIGIPGLSEARQARNNAYSFLDNASLTKDAPYDAATSATVGKVSGLPDFNGQVGRKFDLLDGAFDGSGSMSGRDWQSSIRSLRGERGKIAKQPFGQDAADLMGEAEGNLSGLVNRQLPGGNEALANANAINSRFKTAQAALKGRVAQRNGVLTDPTTLNDVSLRGAEKFGGLDRAMEGNRPFYDLTTAGMDVMPNLTPDSGTAGRSLFYAALPSLIGGGVGVGVGAAADGADGAKSGGGIGLGSTMIPTLALAALYSKTGQKGLQKALLGQRPKILEQSLKALDADNMISKGVKKLLGKRAAGMFGSAVSRDLLLYPELKQPF